MRRISVKIAEARAAVAARPSAACCQEPAAMSVQAAAIISCSHASEDGSGRLPQCEPKENSRLCSRTGLGDMGAQLVDDVREFRLVLQLNRAGARQVHRAVDDDAAGAGGHHEDAVGEEYGLTQVVSDENGGEVLLGVEVADHLPEF